MSNPFSHRLTTLADWRAAVDRAAVSLSGWMAEHDLVGDSERALIKSLRERLASDKLHVAFVAEFSRGKSELINAIFFADAGRRVLPATPGRTTMCPVELAWDVANAPSLALLPIETRLRGLTLADLRGRDEPWTRMALEPGNAESLVRALAEVTRTRRVSIDEARSLGLWDDERPDDNPPLHEDGQVDVPAWRHALINYPHPMLKQGLVVLDTPGLNAIGAEPELTLSLLPSAHAIVFLLAADAGVTRSDLSVWRDHLGARALERFVVLNKIDTLADPMATAGEIEQQIEHQRSETALTLGVDVARVFPLSARDALAARLEGRADALDRSRLPALEHALSTELLPRQQELLAAAARETLATLRSGAYRRLGDQRRQNAEETLELRGLRGKSSAKVRLMLERVQAESAEFERCISRLQALRSVHQKMQRLAVAPLASDALRTEVAAMQGPGGARFLHLGASRAFDTLCKRVRQSLTKAGVQAAEMRQMMDASFDQLNAEYGFAFVLAPLPDMAPYVRELDHIDSRYGKYLGLAQAWRLAAPGAMEQFGRMLLSKLRVVFETASNDLESWSKAAEAQVDVQLRERRRAFKRRSEALERIQSASGELETRITELEAQERHLRELQARLDSLVAATEAATRFATSADAPQRSAA